MIPLKGIIIISFDEEFNASIDTQFPVNLAEFLNISPQILKELSEKHATRKMEPNYVQTVVDNGINIASFYSGFSFRHYVGTPNFAVTVFLSESDLLASEFEGMMRRIAHELLPKREALNFDDILGKYYDMLKEDELTPYWEEIIEGEISVSKRMNEIKSQERTEEDVEEKEIEKEKTPEIDILISKNKELEDSLEEKTNKIRELTRKFTALTTENNKNIEELDSLKDELSEQYIKLEKWNEQLTDLNENNAKLIDEVKDLNEMISEKDNELLIREEKINKLKVEVNDAKTMENEAEKLLQEIEDFKTINMGLNSEIETHELQLENLKSQIKMARNSSSQNLETITELKIEIKNHKNKINSLEDEKEELKSQVFDLKKEIKVLRRERDHYMKLVKDNDLL